MVLSNEIISQFVKTTKDDTTTKKESIVYGTTVEYEGQIYVRFDGSDLLTPVFSTTKVAAGERVTVMIKNHAATITGSTSSPSANNNDVANIEKDISDLSDRVLTVEELVADDATITNLTAVKADIETLKAKDATIEGTLSANSADINTLKADNATITENLSANTADIGDLKAKDATITETLTANAADIGTLKADNATITGNLNANSAAIVELKAKNATIDETLTANRADIDTLTANNAVIEENLIANNADIITLKTNKLDAETAKITYANIDFSNIGKAAMEYLYSQSGLIKDVVVGDATITGKLVGVTISGDLVEANTIVADKLVIQGSDGLYYKLNTDGIKTEAEQTDYNSLNGQVIMAQSITASKIAVDDLVAFDATIGGFNITNHSLYSGVKETANNTTRGVYLDSDGQMALGDGSRFIKYYKTADGSYKLEILADDITLSSEDQSVAVMLADVSEATRTNSEDLAAYISSNNAELENLQTQIDGSITTWFYEYAPTNENVPASEWTTTDLKNNHLGDLFYDTITGYCYRWQVQNNVYSWNRITDVDVTKALADAHTAQDTADAKRRVFVATPTPPYDVGDLWTQGSTGDLMRCQTAKTSGQSYAAADWIKASKYTDDTAANAAQNGVNALQVRMTTAETNISQNAEAIELRATKTELSKTLEGYYTKTQSDSNLTVKADEITSSVASTYATKSALATTNSNVTTAQNTANSAVSKADAAQADIDALDVGGRNLWYNPNETCEIVDLEPGNPTGFDKAYHLTGSSQVCINRFNTFTEELVGKQLTMQCWIKYDNVVAGANPWNSLNIGKLSMRYTLEDGSVTTYHYDSIIAASIAGSSDGWVFMKGTKQLRSDVVSVSLGSSSPRINLEAPESGEAWVTGIKLEFGNVATDWTPPPEEVEANVSALEERVSSAETIISQNAEAIELRALKTEVASAKAEAISTASSDATTKANNALSSANANTAALLENYSTTANMEAAIELKADSITSSVSSIYATKSALATTNNNVTSAKNAADAAQADVDALTKTVTDSYATKSELTQTSNSITSSVSSTYATKSALATTNNNVTAAKNAADAAQEDVDALSETVSNTYATKSELTQTSNSITSSVSSTYATKSALATTNSNVTAAKNAADAAQEDVDALSETVSNTYATKSELTQTSNSITSSVSSTYATKAALATTDANVATAQSTADAAKKKLYHSADGTTATVGYVGFAELTINNNYMNRPICFSLENRGRNASNVEVRFKNANSKDPDLQNLRENGDINVWIEKLETSKWRVIAQKSEGYDTIYVVDYSNNNGNVAVDWVDVHYDTLPTENITASTKLIGSAVASTIATKSEITQLSDRITANVTETTSLGTRMSTVEQTASGLTARLTTAESDIDTAQSTANTAKTNAATAQTTANNAAKTATNYLNYSTSGLVVGDMTASTLGKNVLIDSDSVDIRNGSTVLASFGEDHVTLGRNAEESYIDLCDGAGRISANTAEAATSYPYRNAILIDSQEIETESTRFVATASNVYGTETAPNPKKYAELYMLRDSGSSGTTARLKSEHWNTSTGRYINAGFVGLCYDDSDDTYASMYVSDAFNSVYNSVKVYRSKTVMAKPLYINGTEFTGDNKILWSGGMYMTSGHTATLSEAVSAQANGIVLVFSRYSSSTAQNYHFQTFFIPKSQVSKHPGTGHCFMLTSDGTFALMAAKYLYINDTSVAGHANNNATGTGTSGIKYTNNGYVLRYVVGV